MCWKAINIHSLFFLISVLRLKDALERQRAAQAQRQRHTKDQPGAADMAAFVDRTLEVILSLIDAEYSLEQLMEDRAIINAHCTELREQANPDADQVKLLASLEEELEMRNAQIEDLQQKVCSNDLDSRIAALCDSVQSVSESRGLNKQLLKNLVQQRRDQAQSIMEQKVLVDEQRTQLNEAQQRIEELTKRLRQAEREHAELMVSQQRSYEEKVAVLLRSSHALGGSEAQNPEDLERQQIVEELLDTKEKLQQKLDSINSKTKKTPVFDESVINDSILSDGFEDHDDDPDWVPEMKRPKVSYHSCTALASDLINFSSSQKSNTSLSNGDNPNSSSTSNKNNNNTASNDNSLQSTIDMSSTADESRKSSKNCKCRTKCNTRRCGCFLTKTGCSSNCRCQGNCQNPTNTNKENSTPDAPQNETVTLVSANTDGEEESDIDMVKTNSFSSPAVVAEKKSRLYQQ